MGKNCIFKFMCLVGRLTKEFAIEMRGQDSGGGGMYLECSPLLEMMLSSLYS